MGKNNALLAYVAELYYKRNLSQQEISLIIGASRPTVARLIEEAKEQKIVKIIIDTPTKTNPVLADKLCKTFKLHDALVISANYDFDKSIEICGKAAANLLCSYLTDNMNLGISWGRTVASVTNALSDHQVDNLHISQLSGCMKVQSNNGIDGYEITQALAKKLHATYSPINAPLLVQGKEVYNFLKSEPLIKEGLDSASKINIAINGISPVNDKNDCIHQSGYYDRYSLGKGNKSNKIATFCGRFIDIKGNEINYNNVYSISTPLSTYRKAKYSIIVNATAERAEATMAALNAKLCNILVVDENHAKRLLEIKDQYKKH